jgi:hypothetical protein
MELDTAASRKRALPGGGDTPAARARLATGPPTPPQRPLSALPRRD